METITKASLAASLFEYGLNKRDAKYMVDTFFDVICEALANGEEVRISGFGNFKLRDKTARPGRNPRTGEPASIMPRRVVTFKVGQKLQSQVEQVPPQTEES